MKGLLIKDLCIIGKNKKLYGILFCMMAFLFFIQGESMKGFVIAYMTLIGGSLVLSTISTDEFDKSTTFLMTLPICKKTYAIEKYVFSFGCSILCWGVSTAVSCSLSGSGALELVKVAVVLFATMSLMQLVMIPVQLKFGGENGRMVLIGIIAGVFLLGFAIEKIGSTVFANQDALEAWLQGVIQTVDSLSMLSMLLILATGLAICTAVSLSISMRVMENKEY